MADKTNPLGFADSPEHFNPGSCRRLAGVFSCAVSVVRVGLDSNMVAATQSAVDRINDHSWYDEEDSDDDDWKN